MLHSIAVIGALAFACVAHSSTAAEIGVASVYWGGRTANGEKVNSGHLTAAHKTLPFDTLVKVTRRDNRKTIVVRINDRGPFIRGRIIDLTLAGAHALGFSGLAPVSVHIIGKMRRHL